MHSAFRRWVAGQPDGARTVRWLDTLDRETIEALLREAGVGSTTQSAGVILWKRDPYRVLLVHPTNGKWYGNHSIPKGHPDVGEPLNAAAVRELAEETGIAIAVSNLTGEPLTVPNAKGTKRVTAWAVYAGDLGIPDVIPKTQLQLNEVDDARFLPLDEAQRRISPYQLPFLRLIGAGQFGSGQSAPAKPVPMDYYPEPGDWVTWGPAGRELAGLVAKLVGTLNVEVRQRYTRKPNGGWDRMRWFDRQIAGGEDKLTVPIKKLTPLPNGDPVPVTTAVIQVPTTDFEHVQEWVRVRGTMLTTWLNEVTGQEYGTPNVSAIGKPADGIEVNWSGTFRVTLRVWKKKSGWALRPDIWIGANLHRYIKSLPVEHLEDVEPAQAFPEDWLLSLRGPMGEATVLEPAVARSRPKLAALCPPTATKTVEARGLGPNDDRRELLGEIRRGTTNDVLHPEHPAWGASIAVVRGLLNQHGLNLGETVLGCGTFGCALQTSDPGWVVKVTGDSSEAAAWTALLRDVEPKYWPPGLAKVKCVEALPLSEGGQRLWMIVMERLYPIDNRVKSFIAQLSHSKQIPKNAGSYRATLEDVLVAWKLLLKFEFDWHDLHSDNVMARGDGSLVILDLGFSNPPPQKVPLVASAGKLSEGLHVESGAAPIECVNPDGSIYSGAIRVEDTPTYQYDPGAWARVLKGIRPRLKALGYEIGRMVGSGSYAVAYHWANNPGWVIKLTTDPHEALVWRRVAPHNHPNLAETKCVYGLPDVGLYMIVQRYYGHRPSVSSHGAAQATYVAQRAQVHVVKEWLASLGLDWWDDHAGNYRIDDEGNVRVIDLGTIRVNDDTVPVLCANGPGTCGDPVAAAGATEACPYMPGSNVATYMDHEHQESMMLLDQVETALELRQADTDLLYRQFVLDVEQHFLSEEHTIFPAAKGIVPAAKIRQFLAEHGPIRKAMGQRLTLKNLRELRTLLKAHIAAEETVNWSEVVG